jgi:hypothetical protein
MMTWWIVTAPRDWHEWGDDADPIRDIVPTNHIHGSKCWCRPRFEKESKAWVHSNNKKLDESGN